MLEHNILLSTVILNALQFKYCLVLRLHQQLFDTSMIDWICHYIFDIYFTRIRPEKVRSKVGCILHFECKFNTSNVFFAIILMKSKQRINSIPIIFNIFVLFHIHLSRQVCCADELTHLDISLKIESIKEIVKCYLKFKDNVTIKCVVYCFKISYESIANYKRYIFIWFRSTLFHAVCAFRMHKHFVSFEQNLFHVSKNIFFIVRFRRNNIYKFSLISWG